MHYDYSKTLHFLVGHNQSAHGCKLKIMNELLYAWIESNIK